MFLELYRARAARRPTRQTTKPTLEVLEDRAVPAFLVGSDVTTGDLPKSVAVGDFNKDGKIDVAVANNMDNNVSVFLGNGDGTVGAASNYSLSVSPESIKTADIDGDGNLDLITAGSDGMTNHLVTILKGNADGSFQFQTNLPVGQNPSSVVIADVNKDGRLDIATAHPGASNVSLLTRNALGSFEQYLQFSLGNGNGPQEIVAGDFNGDGHLDLAATVPGGGKVGVLRNDGLGFFGGETFFQAGQGAFGLTVADLNKDGKLDLATTNSNDNSVSVLLGKGDGTFETAQNFAVGEFPESIVAADFNFDGNLDLATANDMSNNASILYGNGNGTFGPAQNYAGPTGPRALAVADFNNDGSPDLVVVGQYGNAFRILANLDRPQPAPAPQPPASLSEVVLRLGRVRRVRPGQYRQMLTLHNTNGQPINGPLAVILRRLGSKVRLRGASGKARGFPILKVALGSANVLGAGESTTVTLTFTAASARDIRYTPTLLS